MRAAGVPLLRRVCQRCGAVFGVCRPCFRGQSYCGQDCRKRARGEKQREANRKHQRTPEGRDDHRDRQRDYRKRQREQDVTDHSCEAKAIPPSFLTEQATASSALDEAVEEEWGELDYENTAEPSRPRPLAKGGLFCIVCGRPGFFVGQR